MDDQVNAAPEVLPVDGVPIAYRFQPGGARPSSIAWVWLGGYRSDMKGTKAERVAALAGREGVPFIRLDYSGHGESGGDFEIGTISRWTHEARCVIDHCRPPIEGQRLILIGSSMGAWIALRLAIAAARGSWPQAIGGLLLLAPAPDFTTDLVAPKMSAAERESLERDGRIERLSPYGGADIFTRALMQDGETSRVMTGLIDVRCPVTILQGMADTDVPHTHALKLVSHLPLENVTLTLIKDGDHRLSREQDLALLETSLGAMTRDLTSNPTGAPDV
ncbi:MAG: alpha/beta hydrolase [Rhizobiaceae bacterium]|jgi:pimeloyl-ACP methyl ester carboxylesterase|nr:alpha/beta hydrolase [Rhizobiaceae bacterium]